MGYQSRKRNYKSRRERYHRDMRNIKIISIFFTLGLGVWMFMNRVSLWDWFKTYFY
jgi:hypothetical protein